MTTGKSIIYHVPFKLNPDSKSASGIRPLKMLEAFRNIGLSVDVVDGTAKERKKKIREIRRNIANGKEYAFCYSESSTQPTLHTEPYAFIKHPFFEFRFFRFLKSRGIKIGLFYRDIYWRFPGYADTYKKKFYKLLYQYDLAQYNRVVDVLFVPSREMMDYITAPKSYAIYELPSGTLISPKDNNGIDGQIEIIYVGGIGPHYNLTSFLKVLKQQKKIHFTLCCRKDEWEREKQIYNPLIGDNTSVVHESGEELTKLLKKADIGLLYLEPTEYRKFAMPYKLMEFIGYGLPVLSSAGTKVAQFVNANDCGWSVEYGENQLQKFFEELDRNTIVEYQNKVKAFAPSQTWEARARSVVAALSK